MPVQQIPIIAETDILVIGGSTDAIRFALESTNDRTKVMVVTGCSYFGENICSIMNFWDSKVAMYDELFADLPWRMSTPMDIKRKLEHKLIASNIDFLFQTYVVNILHDKDGNPAGVLIGNRSGMQVIKCKIVIDGTESGYVAKIVGVPFKQFLPGLKKVEQTVLLPAGVDADGELMPREFRIDGVPVFAWKITDHIYMNSDGVNDYAYVEAEMRTRSWRKEQRYASDKCSIDIDNIAEALDSNGFVYTTQQMSSEKVQQLCRSRKSGTPYKQYSNNKDKASRVFSCPQHHRYANCETIDLELECNKYSDGGSYDVVVIGGGTAGAPAGISSARNGCKTLIIERLPHLGGIGTQGRIAAYWFGNCTGFTSEIDNALASMDKSNEILLKRDAWIAEHKQHYYLKEATRAGCKVWFDHSVIAVERNNNRIESLLVAGPHGIVSVKAKVVIDSTGNADIAAAAGAQTISPGDGEPAMQGTGLPPLTPGNSTFNTDYTFTLESDVVDSTRTFIFSRNNFQNMFDAGQHIDTRERRRIVGDITLMPMDFYLNRKYHDTITVARSNFDTHGFTVHPMFMLRAPDEEPIYVNIPFRALLPKELGNVISTGLGISAHRDALPVVRMQPDVQNQGYAVGIAASMAVQQNCDLRDIDVKCLQKQLFLCGILPEKTLSEEDGVDTNCQDEIAKAFAFPDKELANIKSKFNENKSLDYAILLAFHGDATGKELLLNILKNSKWDEGWHYTGMGQFGASLSKIDCIIIAFKHIAEPEDIEYINSLLDSLNPDAEFSHFRSCCLFIQSHPNEASGKIMEKILNTDGMTGHYVANIKEQATRFTNDYVDTTERNKQLKELYVAQTLLKCDPSNKQAQKIIKSYAMGVHGLYANTAAKSLL